MATCAVCGHVVVGNSRTAVCGRVACRREFFVQEPRSRDALRARLGDAPIGLTQHNVPVSSLIGRVQVTVEPRPQGWRWLRRATVFTVVLVAFWWAAYLVATRAL